MRAKTKHQGRPVTELQVGDSLIVGGPHNEWEHAVYEITPVKIRDEVIAYGVGLAHYRYTLLIAKDAEVTFWRLDPPEIPGHAPHQFMGGSERICVVEGCRNMASPTAEIHQEPPILDSTYSGAT